MSDFCRCGHFWSFSDKVQSSPVLSTRCRWTPVSDSSKRTTPFERSHAKTLGPCAFRSARTPACVSFSWRNFWGVRVGLRNQVAIGQCRWAIWLKFWEHEEDMYLSAQPGSKIFSDYCISSRNIKCKVKFKAAPLYLIYFILSLTYFQISAYSAKFACCV